MARAAGLIDDEEHAAIAELDDVIRALSRAFAHAGRVLERREAELLRSLVPPAGATSPSPRTLRFALPGGAVDLPLLALVGARRHQLVEMDVEWDVRLEEVETGGRRRLGLRRVAAVAGDRDIHRFKVSFSGAAGAELRLDDALIRVAPLELFVDAEVDAKSRTIPPARLLLLAPADAAHLGRWPGATAERAPPPTPSEGDDRAPPSPADPTSPAEPAAHARAAQDALNALATIHGLHDDARDELADTSALDALFDDDTRPERVASPSAVIETPSPGVDDDDRSSAREPSSAEPDAPWSMPPLPKRRSKKRRKPGRPAPPVPSASPTPPAPSDRTVAVDAIDLQPAPGWTSEGINEKSSAEDLAIVRQMNLKKVVRQRRRGEEIDITIEVDDDVDFDIEVDEEER